MEEVRFDLKSKTPIIIQITQNYEFGRSVSRNHLPWASRPEAGADGGHETINTCFDMRNTGVHSSTYPFRDTLFG